MFILVSLESSKSNLVSFEWEFSRRLEPFRPCDWSCMHPAKRVFPGVVRSLSYCFGIIHSRDGPTDGKRCYITTLQHASSKFSLAVCTALTQIRMETESIRTYLLNFNMKMKRIYIAPLAAPSIRVLPMTGKRTLNFTKYILPMTFLQRIAFV